MELRSGDADEWARPRRSAGPGGTTGSVKAGEDSDVPADGPKVALFSRGQVTVTTGARVQALQVRVSSGLLST
jgi:hypothetical protein